MENKDKKECIVKALTKAYEWAKGKGWNETVIKVVLGAIFGVAAAFLLSSCSLGYESTSQRLNVEILPVESWTK
jgi:hypothetical protein